MTRPPPPRAETCSLIPALKPTGPGLCPACAGMRGQLSADGSLGAWSPSALGSTEPQSKQDDAPDDAQAPRPESPGSLRLVRPAEPQYSGLGLRDAVRAALCWCVPVREVVQWGQLLPRASATCVPSFSHPLTPHKEPHSGGKRAPLLPQACGPTPLAPPPSDTPLLWVPLGPPSPIIQAPGDAPRDLGWGGAPPPATQPARQLLSGEDATAFQPWVRGTSQVWQDDWSPHLAASLSTLPSVSGGCLLAACPGPTPCTWAHRVSCRLCSKHDFCLLHGYPDSPPSYCSRPTPGKGLGSPWCALTLKVTAESLVSVCV